MVGWMDKNRWMVGWIEKKRMSKLMDRKIYQKQMDG